MNDLQISKALSYFLRHGAAKEGIHLRPDGHAHVEDLLANKAFAGVTLQRLLHVVRINSKQRFAVSTHGETGKLQIRANQGHSIKNVTVEMTPIVAAEQAPLVIHGTNRRLYSSIMKNGLKPMSRQHIHFATGYPDDGKVISGMRTTSDMFIHIDVDKALAAGIPFYRSANGVILSPGDANGCIPSTYFADVLDSYGNKLK